MRKTINYRIRVEIADCSFDVQVLKVRDMRRSSLHKTDLQGGHFKRDIIHNTFISKDKNYDCYKLYIIGLYFLRY